MPEPNIGSLCTGYRGLEMAVLAVFGGRVVWHAETDPDAIRILEHHQPGIPFAGSGAVLQAAQVEGFRSVGLDLDEDGYHLDLIRERLSWPVRIDADGRFERIKPKPAPVADGQPALFDELG